MKVKRILVIGMLLIVSGCQVASLFPRDVVVFPDVEVVEKQETLEEEIPNVQGKRESTLSDDVAIHEELKDEAVERKTVAKEIRTVETPVVVGEVTPQAKETPPQEVREPINRDMWVKGNVNFRAGSSTDSPVITVLNTGSKVVALKLVNAKWYSVEVDGKSGYVSSNYLSFTKVEKPQKIEAVKEDSKEKPIADEGAKVSKVKESVKEEEKPKKRISNTIYILGKEIKYKNGGMSEGQSIIDKNINIASTWGGASKFSGSDGKNTHFIGHNHGCFNGIWKIQKGGEIIICDSEGISTGYTVDSVIKVDEYGITNSGQEQYERITGSGGGERITLQTCVPKSGGMLYTIFASKK